jgi:hypothetical protein
VPVTHHQPPPALITFGGVDSQIVVDLGLQRGGEHPPGTFAGQLVQIHEQLGTGNLIGYYTQHAASPSSPALPRRSPTWVGQAGGYVALSYRRAIHNFRSYLIVARLIAQDGCANVVAAPDIAASGTPLAGLSTGRPSRWMIGRHAR